jgi:type IV pilus assembly protein PilN
MIRINLLPHRENKRIQRKKAFVVLMGLSAAFGLVVGSMALGYIESQISNQNARNSFIKSENAKLDVKLKEIATLKQEIEGLKARQQAVEDLQADRNQPVHLMDELVKFTPEGVYLRAFKQDGQRVVMNGYAQSNERVSEFLRNLGNQSVWLEKPDLVEIRASSLGQGKDAKKVFDFSVSVGIKRPRDKDQPADVRKTADAGTSAVSSVAATKP